MSREVKPPVIVIDSREATPWLPRITRQGRTVLLPFIREKLPAGDYSILGYQGEIAIERKSLADLVGTLFGRSEFRADGDDEARWEVFLREIDRALHGVEPTDGSPPIPPLWSFSIVVEASRDDVNAQKYRSRVPPRAVWARVQELARLGVPVHFLGGREAANAHAMRELIRWWTRREQEKGASREDLAAALDRATPPAVRVDRGSVADLPWDRLGTAAGRKTKGAA